jgi:hypothetical protein
MGPRAKIVADRKISAPGGIESFIHLIIMTEHSISYVYYEETAIRKYIAYSILQCYWR